MITIMRKIDDQSIGHGFASGKNYVPIQQIGSGNAFGYGRSYGHGGSYGLGITDGFGSIPNKWNTIEIYKHKRNEHITFPWKFDSTHKI